MISHYYLHRKKAIDEELAEIEPLIQEASAAVGNIKSESLSEIRSMRAPPDIIRNILEAVLRLMGILDASWYSMKTFLAKRGIKEEITYVVIIISIMGMSRSRLCLHLYVHVDDHNIQIIGISL